MRPWIVLRYASCCRLLCICLIMGPSCSKFSEEEDESSRWICWNCWSIFSWLNWGRLRGGIVREGVMGLTLRIWHLSLNQIPRREYPINPFFTRHEFCVSWPFFLCYYHPCCFNPKADWKCPTLSFLLMQCALERLLLYRCWPVAVAYSIWTAH